MAEREKPLTLVHGYGFDERGRNKPDIRGRLTILAANELQRRNIIGEIIITAGQQQVGEQKLAVPMFNQLKRNNPKTRYFCAPVSGGTKGELNEFKKLTDLNPQSRLAILATETHLGRIKRRTAKKFGNRSWGIQFFSVEDVLTKMVPTNRYRNLIQELKNSEDEMWFKKQEATIEKIEKFPFGAQIIDMWSSFPYRFKIREAVKKVIKRN